MMNAPEDPLENASMKPSRSAMVSYDGQEQPVQLYRVTTRDEDLFFECPMDFSKNGNDFTVTIVNFGLWRNQSAGNTNPAFRKSFTDKQALTTKRLIEGYFLGGVGKNDFPLSHPNARCLGVRYAPDWIVISD
jgi:hypothetical protein